MKTKNQKYLKAAGILVIGILLGWLLFGGNSDHRDQHEHTEAMEGQIWTCSMHPQIRQDEPGDCPLCGMDLIPVSSETGGEAAMGYTMSEDAMRLANVETVIVGNATPEREIRLNGKVQIDERNSYSQSTHIPGRIEQLSINFTGEKVQRGQTLATVYSPEMVTAQQELLQAARIRESQPELFQAAREKLKNWRISDAQIDRILEGNEPIQRFSIRADVAGVVTEKLVNLGDYVERGMPIYQIADLSKVWVLFDLYERELAAVNEGDQIQFSINSLPGETFEGTVSFIDPIINSQTRVATARVEVDNKDGRLKPEMFATGLITSQAAGTDAEEIVIPKSAVLWTGKRSIVYVKENTAGAARFMMREVELGSSLGNSYVVLNGLQPGDEVVTNGTFTIDAAVQLSGRSSMMNPLEQGGYAGNEKVELNTAEAEKFQGLVENYLNIKNALVEDDFQKAKSSAAEFNAAVEAVGNAELSQAVGNLWQQVQTPIQRSGKEIRAAVDIEALRANFDELSAAMIDLVQDLEFQTERFYVQRCPMANNDKGANWLSQSEEIRNPYYGSEMLTCGEVITIIE